MSWLLVAAALAVPGGSLYVWLTGTVDATRTQEQTIRRQRETPIFIGARPRRPLVNPSARQPELRIHAEDRPAPEPVLTVVPELPKPVQAIVAAASKPVPGPAFAWEPRRDPTLSPTEEAVLNAPPPDIDAPAPEPPRRIVRAKPIQDTLRVEAIIALEGVSSAIVNGIAVKVGDMVGKAKVVLITPERVTFSYRNLRFAKSL